jgi:signal transduction histidine kinase
LANLLHNAAKDTDPGGRISLNVLEDGENLVLFVSDNGIGIGKEQQDRGFDLFVQDARSLGKTHGGLGLTLVRGLVQWHGGSVSVRSDGPGRGASSLSRCRYACPPGRHRPSQARNHVPAEAPRHARS